MFAAIKYFLAGLFVALIGWFFFGDGLAFVARSEPAELRVIALDQRRHHDHTTQWQHRQRYSYRPVFGLNDAGATAKPYAGNIWTRPAPHAVGDVVPGRYEPATGAMRSDRMLETSLWLGGIAMFLGLLIALQSIALICGLPEEVLPLRISSASRRRHDWA
ncbi:MAG: hypothetical protein E6Q73_02765 [Pseudorhodobacter sp.]|nr:MAG: hypothetical protein E6Q73_02765 [Pseudorhodobacter sp.]